ncbi:MAG: thiamine pyrophosphate-binding protein, partial [Rhodospirillaceae bacterium]|nr:thiamine pyrophosphate-binding protein [Rhodospirillaceae bacterium]
WTVDARKDIQAFAKNFDLPVCTSFRRIDIFDNRHPCFVGEMGIAPNPALLERAKASDLFLVVGARIGEMTSQGYTLLDPHQPSDALVHVHANADELGKVFTPALGIEATPENFARVAAKLSPSVRWANERSTARSDYETWRTPTDIPGPLQLGHIMRTLDEHLAPDAICTVDAGNYSGWAQRFLSFGGERRLLGPTSGAMGYAVPAALAAKVARPAAQVVACVGDGGFGMTGNELATAIAHDLGVIILVFNNQIYGTIRMHQERNFPGRVIATDLVNPDFAELARAHGAFGETVETTDQFLPAFEGAVAANKPAVIELKYDANIISTRLTLDDLKPHLNPEVSP